MATACSFFYSKKIVLGSLLGVYLLGSPTWSEAATSNAATLQWSANTESDLAGYKVYHGTAPGVYGVSLNVGNATSYQYANLEVNKTHYFSVTAYDTSGNESAPAPEVSKLIPGSTGMVLSVSVTGNGAITSNPSGLTCSSSSCSGTFTQGTSVTLVATPSSGYSFAGWDGACSGTGNCSVTLTSSRSVSATFSANPSSSLKTLSVKFEGSGSGTVTSVPSGLICSSGTCSASFSQGTSVSLSATPQSGSMFMGWQGACSGTSSCTVNLGSSQALVVTFNTKTVDVPNPPKPTMPFLVNFQSPASQIPENFKKDDGSLFDSSRGYGWSQLVSGYERKSNLGLATATFISVPNSQPSTWSMPIPNGTYFLTLVLGDPDQAQGPHWISAEDLQLTKQVKTSQGEYLTILDYPVVVKDNALTLTLGGDSQGETLLNFLIINSKADQALVTNVLADSFGTSLVTPSLVTGGATKVNPDLLVKLDQAEQAQKAAAAQAAAEAKLRAEQAQKAAAAQAAAEAKLRAEQAQKQKEQELAKLEDLKEAITVKKTGGEAISLQNLFGRR